MENRERTRTEDETPIEEEIEKEKIRRKILKSGDKTVLIQSFRNKSFSHYQIADLMLTTTKTVYEHLKKPNVARELSNEEIDNAMFVVGKPLGFKAGGERPKRTKVEEIV